MALLLRRQPRLGRRNRKRKLTATLRHLAPAFIVLGLTCAGAGAAYTAVAPAFKANGGLFQPQSLVVAIEQAPEPMLPGVVRLPSDPLVAGGPIEADAEVSSGDTLSAVLARAGVASEEAARSVQALREVYDPRTLRDGDTVSISLAPDIGEAAPGRLLGIQLVKSFDRIAGVGRTLDGGFASYEILKPLKLERARGAGTIASSLFVDGVNAGVPVRSMASFIRLFSFDVDFQRDVKEGDKFDIVYDRYVDRDGSVVHSGDILFASLEIGDRRITLYRHEYADGQVKYFNEDGRGNKKALLRTPVDGARISSGFGKRRHPILRYSRMYKGIDFAAPSGTPIKAAGDGVVKMAGWNGTFGRYIRIKHGNSYDTAYAHLRRIAGGVKPGERVRQGQIIGYVGTTGRSTGPHLHYEVLMGGNQVNPLRVKMPSGRTLEGKELVGFQKFRAEQDRQLASLKGTEIAATSSK